MPHTQRAFDGLERDFPLIQGHVADANSFLYVGWRHDCKPWWYDRMVNTLLPQATREVSVLEIFPKNVADLEQKVWEDRYDLKIIQGDVRSISPQQLEKDIVFWDHGPEHVTKEELVSTTARLMKHTKKCLIYCCPWGLWPQGEEDHNEHEIHRCSIDWKELHELGFSVVRTFGSSGQKGEGELLAYYFK